MGLSGLKSRRPQDCGRLRGRIRFLTLSGFLAMRSLAGGSFEARSMTSSGLSLPLPSLSDLGVHHHVLFSDSHEELWDDIAPTPELWDHLPFQGP